MTHRIARRAALGVAGTVLAAPALRAQSNTIRIIVPFAAGGSTDAVARLVTPGLTQRLGQTVIVENRSGAAGSIGTDLVAKARPDGLTWLLTFDSHSVMPVLLPSLPFDLTRDLDPVMLIGGAPYVIATKSDKPYRNLADVVEAAKARPDEISYGSTGNGTIGHLTMVLLQSRTGIRMPHLPYRGGGLAVNDAVAGHIEMMIGSAALVAPHIAGGTLRAVAQFGPARLAGLSQVQTAEEAGFQGLTAEAWWGVFAPHGMPGAMVTRMNTALRETLSEARTRQQMEETQQARLVLSDPAGLRTFLDGEVAKWSRVVRENQIRPD
ncbi:tripartite tricarboxylate transporter substrate binding protein [Plastoroseomonas hellenica]|uniref:tripartite tricarboxylate transporter substrate binding protein n=1 Tax=Plastoroseomonas hellenica TaxID=2687306 RepID=UPI001BA47330|nr:tripartite tricarboxylate transporter substrate binding protein [Plastoroseomonas hellenica]MBR0643390.1 tripartite tricarboxylate transporter substrate binding protein [Plastoroseomonas hellenica]